MDAPELGPPGTVSAHGPRDPVAGAPATRPAGNPVLLSGCVKFGSRGWSAGAGGTDEQNGSRRLPVYAAVAIAVDADENLLIGGYDANGQPCIDTFNTARALGSGARLIRSLTGPHSGLLPSSSSVFNSSVMSIAVDQATGELFVFNTAGLGATVLDQVSAFPARVRGDVPGNDSTGWE
jgi:hypothetical protein